MQLPTTIGLHRSFFGVTGVLVAHGLAMAVLALTPWQVWAKGLCLGAIAASLFVSWHLGMPKVRALRLLADGRLECRLTGADEFISAEMLAGAVVHPWLTVLRLKAFGNTMAVVVLPDSAIPEDYRRLRVWLRWRGEFSAAEEGA